MKLIVITFISVLVARASSKVVMFLLGRFGGFESYLSLVDILVTAIIISSVFYFYFPDIVRGLKSFEQKENSKGNTKHQ